MCATSMRDCLVIMCDGCGISPNCHVAGHTRKELEISCSVLRAYLAWKIDVRNPTSSLSKQPASQDLYVRRGRRSRLDQGGCSVVLSQRRSTHRKKNLTSMRMKIIKFIIIFKRRQQPKGGKHQSFFRSYLVASHTGYGQRPFVSQVFLD